MPPSEAVIVAAARSPIGRAHKGGLKDVRADDLATLIARAALDQVPELAPDSLDDLYLGASRHTGEQAQNLARRVAVLLGLDSVPGAAVSRACTSSLQATRMAFHAIRAGEGEAFLCVGVESVSRYRSEPDGTDNPRFAEAARRTVRMAASGESWCEPHFDGGLPDYYISMGQTAENVASWCGVGRAEQDEYALVSQRRYAEAALRGYFAGEITPVELPGGGMLGEDESPRPGTTLEALAALKPAFRESGTVTAGNCCPLSAGAAALVVLSERRACDLGVRPRARIVATAVSALSPELMGLGPVAASRVALEAAGMTMADMDLVELNEAFAAQVIPVRRGLGIDPDRLNVHGGAIAMGHPFGMTGARLVGTAVNGLAELDKEHALVTLCAGTGQGMALIVERM